MWVEGTAQFGRLQKICGRQGQQQECFQALTKSKTVVVVVVEREFLDSAVERGFLDTGADTGAKLVVNCRSKKICSKQTRYVVWRQKKGIFIGEGAQHGGVRCVRRKITWMVGRLFEE